MMVDTNIIVDLRQEDSRWFDWSLNALAHSRLSRPTASAVVIGELMSRDGAEAEILTQLAVFEIEAAAFDVRAGFRAGLAHAAYRRAGGTRERLLADFLIGAHAATAGQALLTRDPRRYRTYFPELELITPESHP